LSDKSIEGRCPPFLLASQRKAMIWAIRQGVRLTWAMATAAEWLGSAGERLDRRLEATADKRGIEMRDVLEPLLLPPLRS
jgi:hypothetical protein